ncbi:MAG: hypothetical protein WA919_10275 [Coleofasciculaceae cyanobacterium]
MPPYLDLSSPGQLVHAPQHNAGAMIPNQGMPIATNPLPQQMMQQQAMQQQAMQHLLLSMAMRQQMMNNSALNPQIINALGAMNQFTVPMPPTITYPMQKPQVPKADYWIPVIRHWNAGKRAPGRFWRLLYLSGDWLHAWFDSPLGSLASAGVIIGGIFGSIILVTGTIAFLGGNSFTVSPPQGDITDLKQTVENQLPTIDIK